MKFPAVQKKKPYFLWNNKRIDNPLVNMFRNMGAPLPLRSLKANFLISMTALIHDSFIQKEGQG